MQQKDSKKQFVLFFTAGLWGTLEANKANGKKQSLTISNIKSMTGPQEKSFGRPGSLKKL